PDQVNRPKTKPPRMRPIGRYAESRETIAARHPCPPPGPRIHRRNSADPRALHWRKHRHVQHHGRLVPATASFQRPEPGRDRFARQSEKAERPAHLRLLPRLSRLETRLEVVSGNERHVLA